MQDDPATPSSEESASSADTSQEQADKTASDGEGGTTTPVRTPRTVEPAPTASDTTKKDDGKADEADDVTTLKQTNAKLQEELDELKDQVTRLSEKPEDKTTTEGEANLLEGLEFEEGWEPKKRNYAEFGNEMLKRQADLTRRVIQDEVQKATQAQEEQDKANAEVVATVYRGIDRLRNEGKIPAVKDPNDPKDPGIQAEYALVNLARKYNSSNIGQLYDDIYSKTIKPTKPANPITKPSGGKPDVRTAFNYQDIHGKDPFEIIQSEEE